MALQEAMVSSKSNEWVTPQFFFNELHKEFGFTLDPCSTHQNAKCKKHYTLVENGLLQDWSKDVVFMNPPYGREIKAWIKKAHCESLNGATVVCLIKSTTDTSYWHEYIMPYAAQIRFVRGRLKFGDSSTPAPFPSAVIVFTRKYTLRPRFVPLLMTGGKEKNIEGFQGEKCIGYKTDIF